MDTKNDLTATNEDNSLTVGDRAKGSIAIAKFNIEMKHVKNFISSLKPDKAKQMQKTLDTYSDYTNQKILEFANLGLSIANKDYHIITYSGIPDFQIDYKGMLKVASMEARKNGFQLIAKADTVRKGFTRADVITDGLIDTIKLENGQINAEIVTAYAILALMDTKTHLIIMQKVEILPVDEYKNAKSKTKGKGEVYDEFETEMGKKIALRRGVKILNTMFASDVLDKLFSLDNESYTFEKQDSPDEPQRKLG